MREVAEALKWWGLPGDRCGAADHADPLRRAGSVVRGHLGQRCRHSLPPAGAMRGGWTTWPRRLPSPASPSWWQSRI